MGDFLLGLTLGVVLPPLVFVLACLWRRVWDEHDEGRAVMWWDRERSARGVVWLPEVEKHE